MTFGNCHPTDRVSPALQILQILKGFDLKSFGFGSQEHIHYFTEAKKLAFEDRARYYADPDFSEIPLSRLLSDEYADQRRKLIKSRAARRYDGGLPQLEHGDTIYLTTADADRNMVSLIQSNYRGFGSGICPADLGFCLQDRGQLFDLQPGNMNSYAPGKRPFHTIIPAFITKDRKPFMSFGVMGGATQPQGHAQILMNIVDFEMPSRDRGPNTQQPVHLFWIPKRPGTRCFLGQSRSPDIRRRLRWCSRPGGLASSNPE